VQKGKTDSFSSLFCIELYFYQIKKEIQEFFVIVKKKLLKNIACEKIIVIIVIV